MGVAGLPGEVLEVVADFLDANLNLRLGRRGATPDGLELWVVRSTCAALSQRFRKRPWKLCISGLCEQSSLDRLRGLMGALDFGRLLSLELAFLSDDCLRYVLRRCPELQSLEVVAIGDDIRRRPEALLVPSLKHLFLNELPSRALVQAVTKHARLSLFAWNAEMEPCWNWGDVQGWDDVGDEDLAALAGLVDQRLAELIFPDRKRVYDLSFAGVSAAARSSFLRRCKRLTALRIGDVRVYESLDRLVATFLDAGHPQLSTLEVYCERGGDGGEAPLMRIVKHPRWYSLALASPLGAVSRELGEDVLRFVVSEIQRLVAGSLKVRTAVSQVAHCMLDDTSRSSSEVEDM